MIKELSLAVIFGLLIGFGLTGTFYFIKQNNTHKNTPNIIVPTPAPESQNDPISTPTTTMSTSTKIEITSPQNNDIVNTSKITLKGLATPNSLLIVTTPLKNYNFNTDAQGNFSLSIDLEPGLNLINLTAIDLNDQEAHTELSLTYSTAKLE